MENIADLLAMPDYWERRPEAWQRLTCGRTFLDALRQAVRSQGLEQAVSSMDRWRAFVDGRGGQAMRRWETLSTWLICARIASLTVDTASQLPDLLRALDSQRPLPAVSACRAASSEAQRWRRFLRDQFDGSTAPSNSAWMWDSMALLMECPRPVKRSESIGVLLVAESGVIARLTLERLADQGRSVLYPDPSTMSFVDCDREFQQAAEDAAAFVRAENLWRASEQIDVRWQLSRQDGKRLVSIDGGSAGGAFALGLVKLFAER